MKLKAGSGGPAFFAALALQYTLPYQKLIEFIQKIVICSAYQPPGAAPESGGGAEEAGQMPSLLISFFLVLHP
jgi:hypothetical protein